MCSFSPETKYLFKSRQVIRKDYMLKLLQQLDEAMSKIQGKREKNDYEEALKIARESYQQILKLEYQEMGDLHHLVNEKKLEFGELNVIAELLTEEADSLVQLDQKVTAMKKYNLAIDIFDYLNEVEKVFSFEREARMAYIMKQLKKLE